MNKPKVYIVVNGCHENRMDAAMIERYLGEECEFEISDDFTESDIIFVFGCAVTSHMESETLDLIEHLKARKRPEAKIYVVGCISKVKPELATEKTKTDVPLQDIENLVCMRNRDERVIVNSLYEIDAEISSWITKRKKETFKSYVGVRNEKLPFVPWLAFSVLYRCIRRYKDIIESRIDICNDRTFCIKISTGCLGKCSYCSILQARGVVKSKTIDEIMAEFQKGLDQGYEDFALLGTDTGDYGKDLDTDLIYLLEKMLKSKARFRLKLRNVNPRWLIPSCDELCNLLTSRKIIYIQSPVQSGNNRILELMSRGYKVEDFVVAAKRIRQRFPFVFLRSQIIVGFPTETEQEFKDSVALYDTGIFDYVDVFRYTKRPGTKAALINSGIPFSIIMRRYKKLLFKVLLEHPVRKARVIHRLSHNGVLL